ncbi:MAG TPA: hypothetical protein VE860_13410 [Chthoniobacterales bacterium]|jgi:hypothetical protein|nr:hypothetical protein [Chthoniobacterales bacterium]
MKPLHLAIIFLVLTVASASAAYWESEDFNCSINLPDGRSAFSPTNWTTIGSTDEGTLVGASRIDRSAFIFVGYVDISKRKNFHLNEKTIPELEKRYFGPGLGFRRGIQRITLDGIPGYRLTGDTVYHGGHYGLAVDMIEANGLIYQVAAMKQNDTQPLKDDDIKMAVSSFRLLSR